MRRVFSPAAAAAVAIADARRLEPGVAFGVVPRSYTFSELLAPGTPLLGGGTPDIQSLFRTPPALDAGGDRYYSMPIDIGPDGDWFLWGVSEVYFYQTAGLYFQYPRVFWQLTLPNGETLFTRPAPLQMTTGCSGAPMILPAPLRVPANSQLRVEVWERYGQAIYPGVLFRDIGMGALHGFTLQRGRDPLAHVYAEGKRLPPRPRVSPRSWRPIPYVNGWRELADCNVRVRPGAVVFESRQQDGGGLDLGVVGDEVYMRATIPHLGDFLPTHSVFQFWHNVAAEDSVFGQPGAVPYPDSEGGGAIRAYTGEQDPLLVDARWSIEGGSGDQFAGRVPMTGPYELFGQTTPFVGGDDFGLPPPDPATALGLISSADSGYNPAESPGMVWPAGATVELELTVRTVQPGDFLSRLSNMYLTVFGVYVRPHKGGS